MCNDNCPFFNYPAEFCPVQCPYDGPEPDDDPHPSDEELIGEDFYANYDDDYFDDEDY